MKRIEGGGVTAPRGFRASGVAAGIKPGSTKKDCALIVCDVDAPLAGVFTTNCVKAAPVLWTREVCRRGVARAVFTNSGNANACTGDQGERDAVETARLVHTALGVTGAEICVCSTGVIGTPLPMDRIAEGIRGCVERLRPEGHHDAAEAIMTTDTVAKETAVELELSTGTVRIGAMAKGSGMLAPNMATMLCYITTDASVEHGPLDDLLKQAVAGTFNRICVDNDCSTNDTVLCLASGLSDAGPLSPGTPDFETFGEALTAVCLEMAHRLVLDGEGATKFVTIEVTGAESDADALKVAQAVAHSQLCKTAFFGNDANWGRIACAAGYSGIHFEAKHLEIRLEDVVVMAHGHRAAYLEEDASDRVRRPEFTVGIKLGDGPGKATFWTSDLSLDYVRINAEYRS